MPPFPVLGGMSIVAEESELTSAAPGSEMTPKQHMCVCVCLFCLRVPLFVGFKGKPTAKKRFFGGFPKNRHAPYLCSDQNTLLAIYRVESIGPVARGSFVLEADPKDGFVVFLLVFL